MKRKPFASDSMELMLDAICNVFGAVLMIAITIGGVSITGKLHKQDSVSTSEQMQKAQQELTLLQTQLLNTETELALLKKLPLPLSSNTAITGSTAEVQKYNLAVQQANNLADQIEDLRKQQQILQHKNRLLATADQPGAISKTQKKIAQLQQSLQKESAALPTLPLLQSNTQLQPWRLLLDEQGLCYLAGSNQAIHSCNPPGNEVSIKRFEAYGSYFYNLTPIPGRGRKLTGSSTQSPLLPNDGQKKYFIEILCPGKAIAQGSELLKKLRKERYFTSFRIIPDNAAVLRTASERTDYEMVR